MPSAREPRRHRRIEIEAHAPRLDGNAARRHPRDELTRAGLTLVQHDHPGIPPALSQQRQQREEVRLRARDAGHLLHVQHLRHRAASTTRSAQRSTEWSRTIRSRSSPPIARRRSGPASCSARRRVGEVGRVVLREAERRLDAADERLEPLARDDDGQPGRGRFVDDLVQRAGAHVVDEHVAPCVDSGCGGLRHGALEPNAAAEPELVDQRCELLPMRLLRVGQRRPAQLGFDRDAVEELHRLDHGREPLGRRRAPERDEPQRAVVRTRRAAARRAPRCRGRSRRPCARAAGTTGRSTLRTFVASRSASRSVRDCRQCVNQRSNGTPQRARQRRGEHGVDRRHVREHGDRPAARAPGRAGGRAERRAAA